MAVDGIHGYIGTVIVAESGRERCPQVSTRFSLGVENDRADVEPESQTCFARPHSQARTGFS